MNWPVRLLEYVVSLHLSPGKLSWLWDLLPPLKLFKWVMRFVRASAGFFKILDCASLVCLVQRGNISEINKIKSQLSFFFWEICSQDHWVNCIWCELISYSYHKLFLYLCYALLGYLCYITREMYRKNNLFVQEFSYWIVKQD